MSRYLMSSIFESTGNFQLNESVEKEKDPRVDGENIIGSVEGVFFVPDGFSRNNRFYPCELWQRQLSDEDINRRLSNSIMFGCIGHSTGPVTEQDLSEGRVSHIMDKLWIDESTGMGMGKAYILNTPAGKNLKTYLKAGSNLKVSSRGEGSFAEGVEKDGHPVVESSSYNLITFDFVIEPGFVETNPQIMENYIEEVLIVDKDKEKQEGKETEMQVEKILEEYKADRDSARAQLEEQKTKHSEEVSGLNKKIETLQEELDKAKRRTRVSSSVAKSRIGKLDSVVESYSKFGSVEDLNKMVSISKAVMQELKSYKALGTVSEISEAMQRLVKVSTALKEYRSLGSLKSIKELLAMSERFVTLQQKQKTLEEAKKLSEKSGKPIEEISEMIKTDGLEETAKKLNETKEEDKNSFDVVLEVKSEKKPETKESKETSLVESIFADACSKMFILEESDEDEEDKGENSQPDESEDDMGDKEPQPDESEDEEEETDEERLDNLEDKLDDVQSQIDSLAASFDQLAGEETVDDDEEDFDFEIE